MLNIVFNCYFFIRQYLSVSFDNIGELIYLSPPYNNMDMDMNMDMDREIETYKAERKYCNMDGNIESIQLLKKNQSINIRTFKCGYCSKSINIPILMYSDNAFCNTECRQDQIQSDNNININPFARNRNYTV